MNETAETKTCPLCAETIKVAALTCPRCGSTLKSSGNWFGGMLMLAGFATLFYGPLLLGAWWVGGLNRPERDFGPYRDKISVSDTGIHFGRMGNTNTVSTVGILQNGSPYPWKTIQLEVQYFDKGGKLIDTTTETLPYQELPPGMTEAFRIRSAATLEVNLYASSRVFVRTAKDASKLYTIQAE